MLLNFKISLVQITCIQTSQNEIKAWLIQNKIEGTIQIITYYSYGFSILKLQFEASSLFVPFGV